MLRSTLLLFSLSTSLAFAEPNEDAMHAARALAEVAGITDQMEAGFDAMLPIIKQQSEGLGLTPAEEVELTAIYKDWFQNDLDQQALLKQIVLLYAETFTVEELQDLIAFYQTPLGKKTLTTMPQLMAKCAELGVAEGQKKQHLLLEKLTPFFERVNKSE